MIPLLKLPNLLHRDAHSCQSAGRVRPAAVKFASWTLLLLISSSVGAEAQISVDANAPRWVDTGIDVQRTTEIHMAVSGTVNVGARGTFGPEGTTAFPGDRAAAFPAEIQPLYGLAIRLTSSRTSPDDELRQDFPYPPGGRFCPGATGRLWLRVNDSTPSDNSGGFLVDIKTGTCGAPPDPGGRSSRIRVSDDRNGNVEGAEVYVNGRRVGPTDRSGTLVVPELQNGDTLMARKLVTENATPRSGHEGGTPRNWNFRVYLTTAPVNDDGSLALFTVANPAAVQELRLSNNNTLFGLNVVVAIQWDASEEEFRALQNELLTASQTLYNTTDGQFFIERADIYDQSFGWSFADFRLFTNWSLRANAAGNGFFGVDGWMNMARTDWSYVYAHEFAHYGLDLVDEYSDTDGDVICTRNITATSGRFGWNGANRGQSASCLMWNSAPKLCSNVSANLHDSRLGRGTQDCWTFLTEKFRDRDSPERWRVRSPNTRGAIPGSLPMVPFSAPTTFTVHNRRDLPLCAPQLFVVTDEGGRPVSGVDVFSRGRFGGLMLQGQSRMDDTRTATDETGQILATGLHEGDEVLTSGSVPFSLPTCTRVSVNRPLHDHLAGARQLRRVALSLRPFGGSPAAGTAIARAQNVVQLRTAPPVLSAALEFSPDAQVVVRVRSERPLSAPPQVDVVLDGETAAQRIPLTHDTSTNTYLGRVPQLPQQGTGHVQVSATDQQGQNHTRIEVFSIASLTGQNTREVFSANGQLGLGMPAGALPEGTRLAISSSDAPAPVLAGDLAVASGPFKVSASAGPKLNQKGALRFRLPEQPSGEKDKRATVMSRYAPDSFQVRKYNESARAWDSIGGLVLSEISIVTVQIDELGSYVLVARPSNR